MAWAKIRGCHVCREGYMSRLIEDVGDFGRGIAVGDSYPERSEKEQMVRYVKEMRREGLM